MLSSNPAGTDSIQATGDSTLTVQELEAAHLARYDLGPGYPQLMVPEYVESLYGDDAVEAHSLHMAPFWTPEKQAIVDSDIARELRRFLGIRSHRDVVVRTTFTGSIALDRAVAAMLRRARHEGAKRLRVVTTTPCIDIMRLFLAEHADIDPLFAPSRREGVVGALDIDVLLETLAEATAQPGESLALVLTSPENPTGEVWSRDELGRIAEYCAAHSISLIVDHTFLMCGVHKAPVSRIWEVADESLHWIAVWDTGKTFGLNEDKLGFLITSKVMEEHVDDAIAILQFGVARRQKLFFRELFRLALLNGHLEHLRAVCRENLLFLNEALSDTDIIVRQPPAGTLVLLDCEALGLDDESLRVELLKRGIGVVAGRVFFHDEWKPHNYLRLALARDIEHFRNGVEALRDCLLSVRQGSAARV